MKLAGLRRSFRTRNRMREFEAIDMELVEGPFSYLNGGWDFKPLDHIGCKVSLEVEFEVKSRATNRLLSRSFEEICNSLVDAFVRRANDVYGVSGAGDA
jgi:ribosome-associated toxin RatA of RatAB toxin-antitoxin module